MAGILYAPILQQAGFLGGSEAPPQASYIALTDGVTQGWLLSSPIVASEGYTIDVKVKCAIDDSRTIALFSGEGTAYLPPNSSEAQVRYRRSGNYIAQVSVDGAEAVNSYNYPFDGLEHSIRFYVNSEVTIEAISYDIYNNSRELPAAVYDLVVMNSLGVVVNEIPLTNKEQGATQLATVGDVNATMLNYTATVWIESSRQ